MNLVNTLLALDEGAFEKDTKEIEIASLSKKVGNPVLFKIQELPISDFKRAQDLATKKLKGNKTDFDSLKYGLEVINKGVIDPDLKNEDLQKKFKADSPKDLILKLIKAGEISELCQSIEKLSGYNEDEETEDEENEEIKN